MKKTLIIISLVLAALALFAGCHRITDAGAETAPTPVPVSEPLAEEDGNGEEAPAQEAEAEETPAPEDEPEPEPEDEIEDAPRDILTLSVDELVAPKDGTDGALPVILLDCAGADAINDDIDGRFGYLVGAADCHLSYEAHKGQDGRILSVLIATRYDYEWTSYMPYVLDLANGTWLDGNELLALLAVSPESLKDAECDIMRSEFEYEYGSLRETAGEFYDEQLERTSSPENAELDRVWLGDMGQLMFVARIYSLAGAEFYEYPMSAGYSFP